MLVVNGAVIIFCAVKTLERSTSSTNSLIKSFWGLVKISSPVPICKICPSFMMAIRSPMRKASFKSWVIKIIVLCFSSCKFSSSSCMSRLIKGSSAEKASSIKRISGSLAKARAKPTRCCIPPDNWLGYWSLKAKRLALSKAASANWRRFSLATPLTSRPYSVFSKMVLWGKRPKFWKTMLIFSRRTWRSSSSFILATSLPSM